MSPDRLEEALKNALRREEPGPDFAARVLAEAEARRRWWEPLFSWFRPARVRWATAGTLAGLLVIAGAVEYRERQVRLEGEMAKEQVMLALRIAGSKLRLAQEKVQELGAADQEGYQ